MIWRKLKMYKMKTRPWRRSNDNFHEFVSIHTTVPIRPVLRYPEFLQVKFVASLSWNRPPPVYNTILFIVLSIFNAYSSYIRTPAPTRVLCYTVHRSRQTTPYTYIVQSCRSAHIDRTRCITHTMVLLKNPVFGKNRPNVAAQCTRVGVGARVVDTVPALECQRGRFEPVPAAICFGTTASGGQESRLINLQPSVHTPAALRPKTDRFFFYAFFPVVRRRASWRHRAHRTAGSSIAGARVLSFHTNSCVCVCAHGGRGGG